MAKGSKAKKSQDKAEKKWRAGLQTVHRGCNDCGLCVEECAFLATFGTPGKIGGRVLAGRLGLDTSFQCSLCGLCTAVCPKPIDPAGMFAGMRRQAAAVGSGRFSRHRGWRFYERMGTSFLLSRHLLPRTCTTVFFPGCGLAGSRPARVLQVFDHLKAIHPSLGLVLDCCSSPSHILGRTRSFNRCFPPLLDGLRSKGVQKVLVACPSCYSIFREYGAGLEVSTVYEELATFPQAIVRNGAQVLTVHDSCAARRNAPVQEAVRHLIRQQGGEVEEMDHNSSRTLCCGEGGAVGALNGEFSRTWSRLRAGEAGGRRVITYCAGCTNFLAKLTPTSHILDLLFAPAATMAGKEPLVKGLATYWHRWRLAARSTARVEAVAVGRRTLGGALRWMRARRG